MNKQFIKVSDIKSIPLSKGKKVEIGHRSIALFKSKKKIYAIQNKCPHQGADLANGHIKDGKVVCPLHGWTYHLDTGVFVGNENTRIRTYEVKVVDSNVYICLNDEKKFTDFNIKLNE